MSSSITCVNENRKDSRSSNLSVGELEFVAINQARRGAGLPELVCKDRGCIVCGKAFKSIDASHRVCNECRPRWERKRNDLKKAFINIEDTETFDLHDIEDLNVFEDIL